MGNKHLKNSIIPQGAAADTSKNFKYINKNAANLNGWKLEGNNAYVVASIRFVQHNYQCFSDWSKQEMKVFWAFIEKLHNYTWQNLLSTARKTDKSGLAPTIIPKSKYPKSEFRDAIADDIEIFELRVDNAKRVHGFRIDAFYYICWLDKNHEICK